MNREACNSSPMEYGSGSIPEIFELVDRVGKRLTQLQRQTIREADLTPTQYSILGMLWERDGRQFNELASASCCSPSTVTGIVDTLEKKGLVSREPNPEDRRSLLVRLTEKGQALKDSTPTLDRIFNNCCAGIEHDELLQLAELLRKFDEVLIS